MSLERLWDSEFLRTANKWRNSISETDRLAIYRTWWQYFSLWWRLQQQVLKPHPLVPSPAQWKIIFKAQPGTDKKVNYLLHQRPAQMRMLVHFGLLTPPADISQSMIQENINLDQRNYHRQLSILITALRLIPQMKWAVWTLGKIQTIMSDTMKLSTEVMSERQAALARDEIVDSTRSDIDSLFSQAA